MRACYTTPMRAALPALLLLLLGLVIFPAHVQAAKYAVLMNGNNGSWAPSLADLSWMYKILTQNYGYPKSHVWVLSYDGSSYDLDGDGNNDINYECNRANILAVFDTLATRNLTGRDIVFIYGDDHGGQTVSGESYMCMYNNTQAFGASTFQTALAKIRPQFAWSDTQFVHILAVFDQCHSGGFVDSMKYYTRVEICSAARSAEASNYHWGTRGSDADKNYQSTNYDAFTYYWMEAMCWSNPENTLGFNADKNGDGLITFREAFNYAKANDEFAVAGTETPQILDNDGPTGIAMTLDGTEVFVPWVSLVRPPGLHGGPGCWGTGGCGGSGIIFGSWPAPSRVRPESGGGTVNLYAQVHNAQSTPLTGIVVKFYSGVPNAMAWASDTSLSYIGSAALPMLGAGDTAMVGPVTFTPPPENRLGQPYTKVFATMEAGGSPIGSGWLTDDEHVAVENYYRTTSGAGEPVELYYRLRNPDTQSRKIVLKLAQNALPQGWHVQSTPALGETLTVPPLADLPATLRVLPDGIHGPTGVVTVEEELHGPFTGCWAHCAGASESTWVSEGGYIRTTGGISFEVTSYYSPTGILFDDFKGAWSGDGIVLSWSGHPEFGHSFRICRKGPGDDGFAVLSGADIRRTGDDVYQVVDRQVAPGKEYAYRVDYMGPEGLVRSFTPVSVPAGLPAWRVSVGYPNPSRNGVSLSYSVPAHLRVTVQVFDVAGRCVLRQDLGAHDAGSYTFTWDAKDTRGVRVPAGAYLLRISAGWHSALRRVTVLK